MKKFPMGGILTAYTGFIFEDRTYEEASNLFKELSEDSVDVNEKLFMDFVHACQGHIKEHCPLVQHLSIDKLSEIASIKEPTHSAKAAHKYLLKFIKQHGTEAPLPTFPEDLTLQLLEIEEKAQTSEPKASTP